jgi:hypothetical protein
MRALAIALIAVAFAPAAAHAQGPLAQNLSLTGTNLGAGPGAGERLMRFTVTNHGPGPLPAGYQARLGVTVLAAVGYVRPGGPCTTTPPDLAPTGFSSVTCLLPVTAEGPQNVDLTAVFTATSGYDRDQMGAWVAPVDAAMQWVNDADPRDDIAQVDMGVHDPRVGIDLKITVPRLLTHGRSAPHLYTLTNTGGQDLSDVRITDSRCPGPMRPSLPLSLPPTIPGRFPQSVMCTETVPAHQKGEPRAFTTTVTVTARAADGRQVSDTATAQSLFVEPSRACGRLNTRRAGKRVRWPVKTTVADVSCKKIRRQLTACLKRKRAPAGFRCQRGPKFVRLFKPGAPSPTHMMATKPSAPLQDP